MSERPLPTSPAPQSHRVWSYAAVVVLAVVASATGLSNGFALDDLALVADNARVHSLDQWWRLFALPYWPPQYGASLYRPLVTIAYALQWSAGGGAPWVFHLCSVVVYAALCALVLALLLEVLAPVPAVIGSLVFAVHPVHARVFPRGRCEAAPWTRDPGVGWRGPAGRRRDQRGVRAAALP